MVTYRKILGAMVMVDVGKSRDGEIGTLLREGRRG